MEESFAFLLVVKSAAKAAAVASASARLQSFSGALRRGPLALPCEPSCHASLEDSSTLGRFQLAMRRFPGVSAQFLAVTMWFRTVMRQLGSHPQHLVDRSVRWSRDGQQQLSGVGHRLQEPARPSIRNRGPNERGYVRPKLV